MTDSRGVIAFGDFRFDRSTGELASTAGQTRLAPQVAAVLDLLTRRAGQVVTRAELRDALWPQTTVEFDQGLNFAIRQLRIALSDDADQPRYIETLPRRGYRFVAKIGAAEADDPPASAPGPADIASDKPAERVFDLQPSTLDLQPSTLDLQPSTLDPRPSTLDRQTSNLDPRPSSLWPRIAVIGAAILGLGVIAAFSRRLIDARLAPNPIVAVFRFDLSPPDSALDAYRLSLAEQLVTVLSANGGTALTVRGPTFTGRFPGMQTSIDTVRAALHADYSLSGALRRNSAGIRVFAQLIRIADGRHVYAAVQFDSTNGAARMAVLADSIARGAKNTMMNRR